MPYLISDVRKLQPQDGFKYLLDANVWLAVLQSSYNNTSAYTSYIRFFNDIIKNKNPLSAIIVMPSLLLSEIINRIMNDIYYFEYCKNHPRPEGQSKSQHYKKHYRESDDYLLDLEEVCSDIRAYHDKFKFISDNLDSYTCKTLIKNIPRHLDLNDYIYSKIALKQNIIIVTNDSDFKIENVQILTTHPSLLALNKI